MNKLIAIFILGLSVGLGNFAASIAIGLSGVNKSVRLKVALVFGLFETGMPILGLVIGNSLSHTFGNHANLIGGGLLILTGIYEIVVAIKKEEEAEVTSALKNWRKLIIAGLALSIDNLIIGFSLGTHKEPLLLSAVIIGITSVCLALIGLELGRNLGSKTEEYSEVISGIILLLVGTAISIKLI